MRIEMIKVNQLTKHFKVAQPGRGLKEKITHFVMPEYKTIRAVDGVSFEIQRGEILGYLGPNGAGKSTTIKMLTGVLYPTSGSVDVNGLVPYKRRTTNAYNIGVVYGQRSQLWWDLPLIDSFEILRAMYKVPTQRYKQNLESLVELLQMQDYLHSRCVTQPGAKMRDITASSCMNHRFFTWMSQHRLGCGIEPGAAISTRHQCRKTDHYSSGHP
jgi:ABC-2 type transport system ATP-binding protein